MISPAFLKAIFAIITAIISLIIAAETIVPDIMVANDGSIKVIVLTAIPVNTNDTPESGSQVKPKYFVTFGSAFVHFPPKYAPPIFPIARDKI